jgi:putative heme-binding domain-containing protein
MRALARIPTVESAALMLEAAVNAPGGKDAAAALPGAPKQQFDNATASENADTYYAYAAWLSVNDLAPQVMEWIEKTATAQDAKASRDAMITFALQALRPEQTSTLLAKIIQQRGVPLDGSGPWIELIGQSGGPAETRILLNGLLANTSPDGETPAPLADSKFAFTRKEANRRAAAALVVAARRGVKPANPPYGGWEFYLYGPDEALNDILRLAGLWKENFPPAITAHIDQDTPAPRLDAIFESLRTLATDDAANHLVTFLAPKLEKQVDNPFLRRALEHNSPAIRRRALGALAAFRPDVALAALRGVLDQSQGDSALPLWRELLASDKFNAAFLAKVPALSREQAAPALRAARELGKRGEKLVAALTPLAGQDAPAPPPQDVGWLVDLTKKNGNAAEGELIYRRAALTCTVCHAIGGAGGKVGPDMSTLGASAPLDYIIESVMNPAAKVKEGFHAVSLTLKGGRAAAGIQVRETDRDLVLRDAAGTETAVPKSDVTAKENIGSLMPAGLAQQLNDREKASLFAFLAQLGKPGPVRREQGECRAHVARVQRGSCRASCRREGRRGAGHSRALARGRARDEGSLRARGGGGAGCDHRGCGALHRCQWRQAAHGAAGRHEGVAPTARRSRSRAIRTR